MCIILVLTGKLSVVKSKCIFSRVLPVVCFDSLPVEKDCKIIIVTHKCTEMCIQLPLRMLTQNSGAKINVNFVKVENSCLVVP